MEKKFKKPILTGQQIGLLGGPLYTTYKVLGAIKEAKDKETNAVYWLETNDADFNEINKIDYIDKNNQLQTLKWDIDSKGYSCGAILVDDKLIEILTIFFNTINETENTENLKKIVFESYIKGERLGQASLKLAKNIFTNFKLDLFDPSNKEFRKFTKPILTNEAKITKNNSQCNLFYIDNNKRFAIFKKDNNYYSRQNKQIDIENYQLVPNVKTRNICQDAYFKTSCYIAGDGEIAYIKELEENYKKHNVKSAKVKKRMSVTLIEPKTKRLLKKTNLTIDKILAIKKNQLSQKLLSQEKNIDFKKNNLQINEITKKYYKELAMFDIDIKNIRKPIENEIKKQLGLKRAALKESLNNKIKQAEELSDRLIPFGKKQERIFNIFYYMNLFGGLKFIDKLYNNYSFCEKNLEI